MQGALMVSDTQLLSGLRRCKQLGALAMVHAENGDAVAEGQQRVFDAGITEPHGHALSRPAMLEGEATGRAIRLAAFVNTPLYVVHVMSIDAMEEVRSCSLQCHPRFIHSGHRLYLSLSKLTCTCTATWGLCVCAPPTLWLQSHGPLLP
jgi:dihydroorotase-like cyclic amidohydrolase